MLCERALRAGLCLLLVVLLVSPAVAINASTNTRTSTSSTSGTTDGTGDAGGDTGDAGDGGGEGSTEEPDADAAVSCDDRLEEASEAISDWYREAQQAWQPFLEEREAHERALRDEDASYDEWREAHKHWLAQADGLHAQAVEAFRAAALEHLDDCAGLLDDPPREWDGAWTHDVEPEWSPEAKAEPERIPEPYRPPEEPESEPEPAAGDAAWRDLEAEVRRVQAECRDRIDALRGEADDPDDETVRERIHALERDCAQRVRVLYDGYYEEEHREFGDSLGSLRMAWSEEEQRIVVTGRYLELRGDPEAATMEDLSCRGPRYVDRLAADGFLAEFRPEETDSGTALRVFDDHGGLVFDLHDNGRCTLNVASTDAVPWVTLDLADRLACEQADDGDLDCRDGDLRLVVLVHDGEADLDAGNEVSVRGRATFLVSRGPADDADAGSERAADAAAYEAAVLEKRVGAEVRIGRGGDGLAVDAAPIGDLEVRVTGGLDGIDVFVESAMGEGKTVALAMDDALLRALPGVEAFDVHEDGSESPIEVREAASLDDVLDPLDDGEAIEYWFTEQDGASVVLVSIPHFSEKRIHISPDLLGSVGIPAPGLALLAPVLAVAAVVAARRRA